MFLVLGALIIASTKNPRTNLIINKAATGTLGVYRMTMKSKGDEFRMSCI